MLKQVVMKFGGSSVADAEKIKRVASRIKVARKLGDHVVVVVSAPGDTTDDLLEMAHRITDSPSERELDMLLATGEQVSIALLSMALHSFNTDAVSLTGPQAGIYADANHTRARITKILPTKIHSELAKGKVVIVAGFQGMNPNQDITTLGRGGSDLTAVALAAAISADRCEIYTDVKGVYTADPRVVKEAKKLDRISYDEMLELAGAGSQVMQARSIEVAKKYNVELHVRSTFLEDEGTWIVREVRGMEDVVVSGIAFDRNQAKLSILEIEDRPGVAAKIFGALADVRINVDMIIQSAASGFSNDISFTVARTDLKKAMPILEKVKEELGAKDILCEEKVAKVAIVGVGMRSHPGVAAKMFQTLAKAKINIEMISTSEIKVACVLKEEDCEKAVKVLHKAFNLNSKS
ncbi:MAG: aspartate kinase [Elusimicrobia bacterium RIFCSPLOWO2_02_FULL_39_32]|nr:MAG: aspartate kinase [Elusimicrobia bacterium RIFCSPHIGHO2_02_FULL_39_36]OGR92627.1 MAG: aspartate kinase [Elusimicrobia bacterium RIFCSPLOWO2_02_FULL_39_32]OGR99273.1 MAG: aspartate kinase [Elusimicrobia bacterium RIFCSPLOWO2_12_FULL_39_28]